MAPRKSEKTAALESQVTELFQVLEASGLLEQLANPLLDDANEDEALDKAKQIYYKACDASSKKRRLELTKKAIAVSPLCADAFVMLAEHEEWASDAQFDLYEKAHEAGRKSIGAQFDDLVGEFWGWIETRPFMRAKEGLAVCLWERGARAEALDHLRELLHLNPNDNQGVRSILAAYMLEMGLHDELVTLLKAYIKDKSADLEFSRALLAFRLYGDGVKAKKALGSAIKQNQHVAAYLTGAKKQPKFLPEFYSWGDDSEAVHYAANFKKGWDETPGAVDWLRDFKETAKRPSPAKQASVKASSAKRTLKAAE